jgi:predicted glycogen debranching enzyme
MSYIQFDKNQLVDLNYTLTKELLRSNRSGTYSCTSVNYCNTRKYHGLLVVPQPQIDNQRHVLLSSVNETVIQHDAQFNLGVVRYPGTYSPKGHKYIVDFQTDPIPTHTYRVGGVHLKKEIIFSSNEDRILIRYTLLQAHSPTTIRVSPYLAFRNFHSLSKANMWADTKYVAVDNGIMVRMYANYSPLFMQYSKRVDYIHVPDWYNNVEYVKELERGYEGHEDLYVPGYFEFPIEKGEEVIFSIGTSATQITQLKHLFELERSQRTPRNNFENCLLNSSQQLVSSINYKKCIIAGFPWHPCRLRDTFISLPGMTLVNKDIQTFYQILDPLVESMQGPHFTNIHTHQPYLDDSADVSLWFIRALQLAVEYAVVTKQDIWVKYGNPIKKILNGFKNAQSPTVKMADNSLLWAYSNNRAITWMDAEYGGEPITQRPGFTVETNALWYNAVMFAIELAKHNSDQEFVSEWKQFHCVIPAQFKTTFWSKEKGYLADFVNEHEADWSVRPNMLFAVSLPYSPVSEKIRQLIVERVKSKLLTPRGLRTLSPDDIHYHSFHYGNEQQRALSYHQGTVWPWLLGAYTDAYLRVYGKSGLFDIEQLYAGLEDTIYEHAIGSISEMFDGDPPHRAAGAISMAWSVSEVMRMFFVISKFKEDIL